MKKLAKAVKAVRGAPKYEKAYLCGDALDQLLRWAENVERRLRKRKK